MKDVSEITACVIDGGLFLPFARRLAEDCKRVIFFNPDRRSFPSIKQGTIGDGFQDLEHTLDFWPYLDDIDLFCFPDIGNAGLQLHLESIGKVVWGSRTGDSIEIRRQYFMNALKELGLDTPEYKSVTGLTALREFLSDKEDQYIKISRWRGDMETTHWRNQTMDSGWLDWMAVNLGAMREHMTFLVFPSIDTPLEIGGDTYFIDGQWPDTMLNGLEHKDTTYFSAVTARDKMPDQVQDILEAFQGYGRERRYRNQWSMEIRVAGDKAFFIDATCRGGMPSSASQQLLWKNFSEIVWAGANGEMVQPDPAARFSIECMVTTKTGKDCWDVVKLPEPLERSCRFSNCAFVDGCYAFAPDEFHSGELGWLCAIGDTPKQTLDQAKELADQLPDGLDANLENLTGLIEEIDVGEAHGIPFTDKPLPEPAEVIED